MNKSLNAGRLIFESFLDLTIGACSRYIFYSFYGLIASFSLKHNFIGWVPSLPQDIQVYSYFLHSILEESISAIPIIALAGTVLGLIVKGSPLRHSVVVLLGVIGFDVIYYKCVINDIGFFYATFSPVWTFILRIFIWVLLFICMISIGYKISSKWKKDDA